MVTKAKKNDSDPEVGVHAEDPFPESDRSPEEIHDLFRQGKYPYDGKINRSVYEAHKKELQVELLKAQNWVKGDIVFLSGKPDALHGFAKQYVRMEAVVLWNHEANRV